MPHFKKNPTSGTWYVRFDVEEPGRGGRCQVHLSAATRKELAKMVATYVADVERTGFADRSKVTFSEACNRWLKTKQHLAVCTVESYESVVRLYLIPRFGQKRISKITSADVQAASDAWVSQPTFYEKKTRRKPKRRSNTTTRYALTILVMVFKWARAMQLVAVNPVENIMRPRVTKPRKAAVTPAIAAKIILIAEESLLHAPIHFAFIGGFRRGELVGLRRLDASLERGELDIVRTVVCRGKRVFIKEPKTAQSMRTIFLDAASAQFLKVHLDEQELRLREMGIPVTGDTALFDCGDGSAWNPDAFGQAYRKLLQTNGVPHVKLNGTRHSFASIAFEAGVAQGVIQHTMGHESERTALDWYTTVTESAMRSAHAAVSTRLLSELEGLRNARGRA
jgi:integrase